MERRTFDQLETTDAPGHADHRLGASVVKEKGFIQRRVMAGLMRVERRMARPRLERSREEVNMFPVLRGQYTYPQWQPELKTHAASSPRSPAQVVWLTFPGMTPRELSGFR